MSDDALGGQKRALGPLELEFLRATELRSLERAVSALKAEPFL